MYFSYIFCIFVTVFVSVKCNDGHHIAKKHNDFTAFKEVDCFTHRDGLRDSMNHSSCKPHYKHVHLKSMPLQEFLPSMVRVKRCHGNCPGNSCMPIKTHMIKIPVRLAHRDPNRHIPSMCALVEVEEHITCRCMCKEKKEHCNPETQYYLKSSCACACLNHDMKKHKCEQKMGMVWDEDDCSCNCTEMNMECTTGLMWNKEKCACIITD